MKLNTNEKIKQIKEFPNYYITNQGRVWSNISHRWLKPTVNKRGNYSREYVSLGRGNKRYVHQLVAKAFIPNPNNFTEVDHIDSNGLNNNASNLRWVTHEQNMKNIVTVEKVKKNTGFLNEIEYLPTGEKFWGYEAAAKAFKVNKVTIYNHVANKVKNPKWKSTGRKKHPKKDYIIEKE